jgi:hypothetical protein
MRRFRWGRGFVVLGLAGVLVGVVPGAVGGARSVAVPSDRLRRQ